ncbi:MAG: DUF4198 domain-containing protein [Litoreibacter sp.]|nr:DUF4198 domain-containing protein [Litoreibacter sp.]MCY4336603.1 DUF4198 domain-containing protein [Litoreibacter sp.]
MRVLNSVITSALLACATMAANAHEFWIDPDAYQVQAGDTLKASLRVGEEFSGSSYPYRPSQITRFELVQGETVTPVEGRMGDNPALETSATDDGLLVIVHETGDNTVIYSDFAKFEKFVSHKAFPDVIALHAARGISKDRFVESYRRYAKSLVAIGEGAGADRETGLKTEIVALANPYTDTLTEMPVKVLLDGAPRANTQVELFEKAPDETVQVTFHQTDGEGIAQVPVKPGHTYLVDAVWAEALPNDDADAGPVWKTHWAALTFAMPK